MADLVLASNGPNPFGVKEKYMEDHFTENLSGQNKTIFSHTVQKERHRVTNDRGNQSVACMNPKPQSFNILQFQNLLNLRSYRNLQLRKLLVMLSRNDSLPFHENLVHTTLQQVLFHVGTPAQKDKEELLHFEWMSELTEKCGENELGRKMSNELKERVDDIKDAPARHRELLLYGTIAAFASQFIQSCCAVAIEFAEIAETWASERLEEIKKMEEQEEFEKSMI